jgi:sporulation protein YlmC with PRC-barrel domain
MMLRSFKVVLGLVLAVAVLNGQALRVSQLIKMEVRSASNEIVGEVKDIVLDPQTGGFTYAVVSMPRLPGKAGKLFAVPWQAITASSDRKSLVLAVSNDALKLVPGFEANSWPDLADPRYAARLSAAWGISPRPQASLLTDEPRVIGALDPITRPAATGSRVPRSYVISGIVDSMYPGELSEAVISTENGYVDAVLAPISFLNSQQLTFAPNANVRLKGRTELFDGRFLFVVTEAMTRPGLWVRVRYDDLSPAWTGTVAYPLEFRYLTGTVESGSNGYAVIQTYDEGLRTIAIAPSNYFDSRHWRLRPDKMIGVTGYDDPVTGQFIAVVVDHENETWRVRRDDGTPIWRED